jgi:hypothetical protein
MRGIQYAVAGSMSHQRLRLLDHPHSRMMTSGARFTTA